MFIAVLLLTLTAPLALPDVETAARFIVISSLSSPILGVLKSSTYLATDDGR